MFDIGGPELMLIMFIFLLLFGAKKLPELAKGFGKSMREFKKAASGVENEVRRAMEEDPTPPKPKPVATIQQTPPPDKPAPQSDKPELPPPAAD